MACAIYIYIKCRWKRLHFILLQRTPAINLHLCTSLICNLQLDELITSKRIHMCVFESCTNAYKYRFCMHIHRAMMMVMTMMINVFIVVVVVHLWRLRDINSYFYSEKFTTYIYFNILKYFKKKIIIIFVYSGKP